MSEPTPPIERLNDEQLEALEALLFGLRVARPLGWSTGEPVLEDELEAALEGARSALRAMKKRGVFGAEHTQQGEEE